MKAKHPHLGELLAQRVVSISVKWANELTDPGRRTRRPAPACAACGACAWSPSARRRSRARPGPYDGNRACRCAEPPLAVSRVARRRASGWTWRRSSTGPCGRRAGNRPARSAASRRSWRRPRRPRSPPADAGPRSRPPLRSLDALGDGLAGDLLGEPAALLVADHRRQQRGDQRLGEAPAAPGRRTRTADRPGDRCGRAADRLRAKRRIASSSPVEQQVAQRVSHGLAHVGGVPRLAVPALAVPVLPSRSSSRRLADHRREPQVKEGVEGRPVLRRACTRWPRTRPADAHARRCRPCPEHVRHRSSRPCYTGIPAARRRR